jgi:hypothetical protein
LKIDLQAQKFPMRAHKEGCPDKFINIQGRLCMGAFGVWEYCFPREYLNQVLTTLLHGDNADAKKLGMRLGILRKFLKCKAPPKKWDTSEKLLWINENLSIIVIGIRDDEDIVLGPNWGKELDGYTTEGI